MKLYSLDEGKVQLEAEMELGKRLAVGSISHVALFAVVILSTPIFSDSRTMISTVGLILLLVSAIRFYLSRRQRFFYTYSRKTWLILFDICLAITACVWGFLCERTISQYGVTSRAPYSYLSQVGLRPERPPLLIPVEIEPSFLLGSP